MYRRKKDFESLPDKTFIEFRTKLRAEEKYYREHPIQAIGKKMKDSAKKIIESYKGFLST